MPDFTLTELERRTLGALPHHEYIGGEPEQGLPGEPERRDLAEVTEILATDPHAVGEDTEGNVRAMVAAEVLYLLEALVGRGFAECVDGEDAIRRWRHTKLGDEARNAIVATPNLIPGPAVLELDPGKINSTLMEG